jgi:hypothetical protein
MPEHLAGQPVASFHLTWDYCPYHNQGGRNILF